MLHHSVIVRIVIVVLLLHAFLLLLHLQYVGTFRVMSAKTHRIR